MADPEEGEAPASEAPAPEAPLTPRRQAMLQDITGVLFLYSSEYRGYLAGQRQAWELFQANRRAGGSAGSGPSGKLPLLPRL